MELIVLGHIPGTNFFISFNDYLLVGIMAGTILAAAKYHGLIDNKLRQKLVAKQAV